MSAAASHAHDYWYRPCADGQVWTPNAPVDVNKECQQRRLNPTQWVGRFLNYERSGQFAEGLFLVPDTQAGLSTLNGRSFYARNYPEKVFLCSWSDNKKDTSEGQTPPFTGLNDCSHFVSECLQKAGISTWSLNAPDLVKGLRARHDTKTLCFQVDKDAARWIINAGIMSPGDVVAYSDWSGFRHATLYLGDRMIAMHTTINHPQGDPGYIRNDGSGPNNWETSAHDSHPKVTLIHFSYNDRDTRQLTWVPGWWKVSGSGGIFYYHLTADGRATWTAQIPKVLTMPPAQAGGRGYWFVTVDRNINICWTETGTLEFFRPGPNQTMSGASASEVLNDNRIGP